MLWECLLVDLVKCKLQLSRGCKLVSVMVTGMVSMHFNLPTPVSLKPCHMWTQTFDERKIL